jgi:hypothetical protein
VLLPPAQRKCLTLSQRALPRPQVAPLVCRRIRAHVGHGARRRPDLNRSAADRCLRRHVSPTSWFEEPHRERSRPGGRRRLCLAPVLHEQGALWPFALRQIGLWMQRHGLVGPLTADGSDVTSDTSPLMPYALCLMPCGSAHILIHVMVRPKCNVWPYWESNMKILAAYVMRYE